MKKLTMLLLLGLFALSSTLYAQKKKSTGKSTGKKSTGNKPSDFKGTWGTKVEEALKALKIKGNTKHGAIIYEEICANCHQPEGHGDPAGNFPQLAGQHSTVVIKQIADIRAGNRDNPTMYPFANAIALQEQTDDLFDKPKTGAETLADVSAFIETLKISTKNAKGDGKDLAHGEKLYKANCVKCHGDHGEGKAKDYYPLIASQNYNYLMRQFKWIKAGKRRNANPDMIKQIKNFSERDMKAVLDYVSRQVK
ncbi:MAG: c-type cytochrome [Bacteriovoracaceae bacterium]|jgi:cytochrome c553|nr:c-type cytochrome [Bacteriovoracaceae bacterium]